MSQQRKIAILAAVIMSGIMSFCLSGFLSWLPLGFVPEWPSAWMHSWVIAWPLACVLVILLGPRVGGLAARLVARYSPE
ncbi:DUF2798 domain-containing protein [Pseudooceanicola sp. 200-1SW]|uniref:DUF2798 domain-containing protein n=1 Tax=Pseudooceanicola sp. 200-1SW TaxID=3425949 RepID=UPI003D7FD81F